MSKQTEDLLNRNLNDAFSLLETKKYKKALEKLDKAENLAEKLKSQDFLCQVLLQKGAVLMSMDKPDEGQAFYDKALDILRTSDLDGEDSELQFTLLKTLSQLAGHFKRTDSMENAEKCYLNKIKVHEILLEKNPEDTDNEIEIALINEAIGKLYERFKSEDMEPENAMQYYEKLLKKRERAFELVPESNMYRNELVQTLGKLVDLHVMQQDYESAIELQERAIEAFDELFDDLAHWSDLKAKSNAYDKLGSLYAETGKKRLAKEQYSEALEYYEMILDDGTWPLSVKMMLVVELMERGNTFLLSKEHVRARESMDLALKFLKELDKEELDKLEEEMKDSAKGFMNIASVFLEEGEEEEKLEDSGYLTKITEISGEYAKTLSELGRDEDAKKFTVKSEKVFGKLSD